MQHPAQQQQTCLLYLFEQHAVLSLGPCLLSPYLTSHTHTRTHTQRHTHTHTHTHTHNTHTAPHTQEHPPPAPTTPPKRTQTHRRDLKTKESWSWRRGGGGLKCFT